MHRTKNNRRSWRAASKQNGLRLFSRAARHSSEAQSVLFGGAGQRSVIGCQFATRAQCELEIGRIVEGQIMLARECEFRAERFGSRVDFERQFAQEVARREKLIFGDAFSPQRRHDGAMFGCVIGSA